MQDFSGRPGAALVVGGSGGLGAPIARMLAALSAVALAESTYSGTHSMLPTSQVSAEERKSSHRVSVATSCMRTTICLRAAVRHGPLPVSICSAFSCRGTGPDAYTVRRFLTGSRTLTPA